MISSMGKTSSPDTAPTAIAPMCARSSSASAESSAIVTTVSTTSKTTPVLDTAGTRKDDGRRGGRRAPSLAAKAAFLGGIFALVPVFLYLEFRSADQDSQ